MATNSSTNGIQHREKSEKGYHRRATGLAAKTADAHSGTHDLKLFGSCFCPFVQRVWISLEAKNMNYQYLEIDPYEKPKELTDINPRGLVPALKHGEWGSYESTVLMEYLEDLGPEDGGSGKAILPASAQDRAKVRLWTDHVNRNVIPGFYRLLQAQETDKQAEHAKELSEQIAKLVSAADPEGPFFLGKEIGFVDVQMAPWVVRLRRVLMPYRGWPEPEKGSRWEKWVRAIEEDESVKATTSDDQLYVDSYARYAENRPGTSQVADAVNSGRGLP